MRSPVTISEVRLTEAPFEEARSGLLGWVTCTVNDTLRLDGITLRRTADGRLTLSFPARRDSTGRQHAIVRPIDDRTRRELERQVFRALGFEETAR